MGWGGGCGGVGPGRTRRLTTLLGIISQLGDMGFSTHLPAAAAAAAQTPRFAEVRALGRASGGARAPRAPHCSYARESFAQEVPK